MDAESESQKVKLLEFFDREVARKKKTVFAAVAGKPRPAVLCRRARDARDRFVRAPRPH